MQRRSGKCDLHGSAWIKPGGVTLEFARDSRHQLTPSVGRWKQQVTEMIGQKLTPQKLRKRRLTESKKLLFKRNPPPNTPIRKSEKLRKDKNKKSTEKARNLRRDMSFCIVSFDNLQGWRLRSLGIEVTSSSCLWNNQNKSRTRLVKNQPSQHKMSRICEHSKDAKKMQSKREEKGLKNASFCEEKRGNSGASCCTKKIKQKQCPDADRPRH